jgi:hypothetical protein
MIFHYQKHTVLNYSGDGKIAYRFVQCMSSGREE